MAIAFVAAKEGNSDTDAASYSITPLPVGILSGHVAVIVVSCPTTTTGATAFSGWTQVYEGLSSSAHMASVWYRVAQVGDLATTAFTFDPPGTAEGISWVCSAYSGVDTTSPFLAQDGTFSALDADGVLASPTVNNTSSVAWRVSAAASGKVDGGGDSSVTWTADIGTERNDIDSSSAIGGHSAAMYDSNGTISTGNTSVTHTLGSTTTAFDLISWVGILQIPSDTGPAGLVSTSVTSNQPVSSVAVKVRRLG